MSEFTRYCGRCHDCGTRLAEYSGEEHCSKCNEYKFYYSHGKHQSMYEGDYHTQVDNTELCPISPISPSPSSTDVITALCNALKDAVPALAYMDKHGNEDYISWEERLENAKAALELADKHSPPHVT